MPSDAAQETIALRATMDAMFDAAPKRAPTQIALWRLFESGATWRIIEIAHHLDTVTGRLDRRSSMWSAMPPRLMQQMVGAAIHRLNRRLERCETQMRIKPGTPRGTYQLRLPD